MKLPVSWGIFGFVQVMMPTFANIVCPTAAGPWSLQSYGNECTNGVTGPSASGASGSCFNLATLGRTYGRSVDASFRIYCGTAVSTTPSRTPVPSPSPSVTPSNSMLPSAALRFYSTSPDCVGARNDTKYSQTCRTCWWVTAHPHMFMHGFGVPVAAVAVACCSCCCSCSATGCRLLLQVFSWVFLLLFKLAFLCSRAA